LGYPKLIKMISKAYEKADFKVVEFEVEDVLTTSTVVHTTTEPNTTLPGSGGGIGVGGGGDTIFDFTDFFPQ
jgi:hypothetical protein